ncbi:MAG: T9SS type A sorting domain-containing protein [Saprospiraceae bacterium]|nr:T9SS type A sorting domain-containing protein [Saprospiraceae bacterium]
MKTVITFLFVILFCFQTVRSQELISATYKGLRTKQQITALFGLPIIKYGAKFYHIKYTSQDAGGNKDTLSGLMVVPDDLQSEYPRLVYQHGTSDCKTCVPSRFGSSGGEEGQLGLLFAGLGFVSILPDLVGMGDGRGFQTYVHAATTVSATNDMLTACNSWASQNQVFTNEQLFITGYSQGGYSSMALHKHLEEFRGAESVTAAAHLSGPYSLSGVMRDLILSNTAYFYPAYVPNTLLGFNEVYGDLYSDLNEIFKPEYVADIRNYYNGSITLSALNTKLIQLLTSNTGASVAGRMIRDEVMTEIISDNNHKINKILRENDLHSWAPEAPTRIFYCRADDQVPFMNSIVARDSMLAKGASNLVVTDVNPNANHGQCVTPALTQTVFFFLGLQRITSGVNDSEIDKNISVYPNPFSNTITLDGLKGGESIIISDMEGKQVFQKVNSESYISNIDLSSLASGLYFVIIRSENNVQILKVVKI